MISPRTLARSFVPKFLRKSIKDMLENIVRLSPGKHDGNPEHGLDPTQIYPKGVNFYSVLEAATKEKLLSIELTPITPVASIGSCFAEEFAFFMRDNGYNYISTEQDAFASSANWGRVYTIHNFLQIVDYSIDEKYPILIEESEKGWFDPLREATGTPFYSKKETAIEAIKNHRRSSYEAFSKCEILIVTLGQNEAWKDIENDVIWARIPPSSILEKRKKSFTISEFNFSENLTALKKAVNLLQRSNSGIKIIFTISPVASYATFSDKDVISNSFSNKCLLRTVVKELIAAQSDKLFYFPSFEMVLCDNPHNFRADNRHVKYAMVDRIFSLLSDTTSLN